MFARVIKGLYEHTNGIADARKPVYGGVQSLWHIIEYLPCRRPAKRHPCSATLDRLSFHLMGLSLRPWISCKPLLSGGESRQ